MFFRDIGFLDRVALRKRLVLPWLQVGSSCRGGLHRLDDMRLPVGARALLSLGVLVLFAASVSFASESASPLSFEDAEKQAALRAYSIEQLQESDGTDPELPILLAVHGIVFDVSSGREHYSPGANYHVLAGRDASRAMATMSMEPDDLTDRCDDLDADQAAELQTILTNVFLAKYPVVGHLKGGFFYPDGLCCHEDDCGPCADRSTTPEMELKP